MVKVLGPILQWLLWTIQLSQHQVHNEMCRILCSTNFSINKSEQGGTYKSADQAGFYYHISFRILAIFGFKT